MPSDTKQMWTKGPWAVHRTHLMSGDAWYVVVDSKGYGPVMDVGTGNRDITGQIAEAKYLITNPDEIEANARLISLAPEMAEALDAIIGAFWMKGKQTNAQHDALGNAERILRRARGE